MHLSDLITRKFTSSILVDDFEVLTDSGWVDITHSNKTIPYEVYVITTESGRTIRCADQHIFFEPGFNEIFAMDCDGKSILTEDGSERVVSVNRTGHWEEMYDLSVGGNNRFYTNGILSHNTTVMAAAFCHYVLFNKNKTCAILANKASTAREILSRVQLAYEHLPKWMQQGVVEWNKGSFSLENGSRIMSSATSSSAIRGFSINFLFIDECAFIPSGIAEDFFTSVYPTISSGKTSKLCLISTPNGMNLFYRYWMEALNGTNGFLPIKAIWSDIPGRDEKWANEQRAVLGPVKFRQEMCVAGETQVTVRCIETGEVRELTIEELDESDIAFSFEILTPSGFQPFSGISKKYSQETIRIVFSDGTDLIATPDHILVDGAHEFAVSSIEVSDVIFNKTVTQLMAAGKRDVYDPINVSGGNVYYSNGIVSHNCVEFIGSENTLISGEYISGMPVANPIHKTHNTSVYQPPTKGRHYVMCVDTARGTGGDYSAFIVIDVTSLPYRVAAVYRDNKISSYIYPNVVFEWARKYNEAYVYIELNDIGESIAHALYYDMEYENLVMSSDKGVISSFGGKVPGVRTTHRSKIMGCDSLKQLIEGGKLEVNDPQLILEISNFARKGRSFEAANGNDDLVMCLVMFGYLLTQPLMEELTSDGAKQRIIQEKLKAMDEELLPAMIFDDGTDTTTDGWIDV